MVGIMFHRLISIMLLIGLLSAPVSSLALEGQPPPNPPLPSDGASGDTPSRPVWEVTGDRGHPIHPLGPRGAPALGGVDVNLGEPGFTMRYEGTYGVVEQGYFEDTTHLNFPYGIWAGGSTTWIADSYGNRALNFDNSGVFLRQIGTAGFSSGVEGTDLDWIADVAVDSSGGTWLVDRTAHHIAQFDASGNLVSDWGEPWVSGTDDAHFNRPESIAFDSSGNLFISDGSNHRVQILSPSGDWINRIGVTGVPGSSIDYLNYPRHIAIDADNLLYIADTNNHRVQIFDVSQPMTITYQWTLGVPNIPGNDNEHLNNPAGVAVSENLIFVADQSNSRIQIFNRMSRAYLATIQNPGSGVGQFLFPTDVAVDGAGFVYIVDQNNARVQQFNASYGYVYTYGTTGVPYLTDNLHYNRPAGVAIAPDGSQYMVESYGNRLLKLNASGVPVWQVGEAGVPGSAPDHFNRPADVAVSLAGLVYVVDRNNHRVQIFDSDGFYVDTLGSGPGNGTGQFNLPRGIDVDASGNIYIADTGNHRIEIFDSSLNHIGRIGTGVPGQGDNQFYEPFDVEVDDAGNIYVADHSNHRIQIFDGSLNFVRRIGVTGVPGLDFGHLDDPTAVVVDTAGRTYVADNWGGRIQIFDDQGNYLTTLGNSWGNRSGDLRQVQGLAVDGNGSLFIADCLNHRIQVFSPGVPDWSQSNINGFGDPNNQWAASLVEFQGTLYVGVHNVNGTGAELWRWTPLTAWEQAVGNGFGNPANAGVSGMIVFQNQLYAGTENLNGAEIWRSADGENWSVVVDQGFGALGDAPRIAAMGVYNGMFYAATGNWLDPSPPGAQIWRTADGINWVSVVTGGFGDNKNTAVLALEEINGFLYAGTRNELTGGEIWRSPSGNPGSWTQVNQDGFGDISNTAITSLVVFRGMVYAGTRNWEHGAEVWRSPDGVNWSRVVQGSLWGGQNTGWVDSLSLYNNFLYAVTRNYRDGAMVWSSVNGSQWRQVNPDGWGDNNIPHTGDGNNAIAVYDNDMYVGTMNTANGAEIWVYTTYQVFIPFVSR